MKITGNQWKSMEINGNHWKSMEIIGNQWKSLEITGNHWKSMEINGNQGTSMEINGNQWKSMVINENQWKSMEINRNQWKSMKITGNQWKSIEINGKEWPSFLNFLRDLCRKPKLETALQNFSLISQCLGLNAACTKVGVKVSNCIPRPPPLYLPRWERLVSSFLVLCLSDSDTPLHPSVGYT